MRIEITGELIAHVARLARLALTPDELQGMEEHFRRVVAWVDDLQSLDLAGVHPSLFSLDVSGAGRPDEIEPSLAVDAALENAPRREGAYFSVPRIVGEAEATP